MDFLRIKRLFKSKSTTIIIFSIISFFLFSDISFAAESTSNLDSVKTAVQILQSAVQLFASLLGIITAFVSAFLHPSWVNGSIFGLEAHFKTIWILISNVVYFIFALVLVGIAFMNIIGQGKENYAIKQALPKLVVGVLIVPVSWFFVQFILSISAILTVSVLSLPFDTFKDQDFFKDIESQSGVCTHWYLDLSKAHSGSELPLPTGKTYSGSTFLTCDKDSMKTFQDYFNSNEIKNSIFGIISIYTYGVMQIDQVDKLLDKDIMKNAGGVGGTITSIADLLVNKVIFDIIFFLIYFILMVALFIALFTRGVWLWIYTMFSPIFGLLYFFGKSKEGIGKGEQKFSIVEFIKLSMVPVLVAAALSFGLLFLFVIGDSIKQSQNNPDPEGIFCKSELGSNNNCIGFAGFKLEINGPGSGVVNGESDGFLGIGGFLGNTILKIFGLVVLWMSIMAALGYSEITNKAVKPIMEFGDSIGNLASSGLKYLPIIPAPGGGAMSADTLSSLGPKIANIPEDASRERATEIANLFDYKGRKKRELGDKFDKFTTYDLKDPTSANRKYLEILPEISDISNLVDNNGFKNSLEKLPNGVKANMDKVFKLDKKTNKYIFDDDFKISDPDGVAKVLKSLNDGLIKSSGSKEGFLGNSQISENEISGIIKDKANATANSNAKPQGNTGSDSSKSGQANQGQPPANGLKAENGIIMKDGKNVGSYTTNNNNTTTINVNNKNFDVDNSNGNLVSGENDIFVKSLQSLGSEGDVRKALETMFAGITDKGRRDELIKEITKKVFQK